VFCVPLITSGCQNEQRGGRAAARGRGRRRCAAKTFGSTQPPG
jgi:hypothetical protein